MFKFLQIIQRKLESKIFIYVNKCKKCNFNDVCEKQYETLNYKNIYDYFKKEGVCFRRKNKKWK